MRSKSEKHWGFLFHFRLSHCFQSILPHFSGKKVRAEGRYRWWDGGCHREMGLKEKKRSELEENDGGEATEIGGELCSFFLVRANCFSFFSSCGAKGIRFPAGLLARQARTRTESARHGAVRHHHLGRYFTVDRRWGLGKGAPLANAAPPLGSLSISSRPPPLSVIFVFPSAELNHLIFLTLFSTICPETAIASSGRSVSAHMAPFGRPWTGKRETR